jgi:hypothetical protein
MSTEKIQEQLEALVDRRGFAKFVRSIPGCEVLHGFALAHSKSLVLLHVIREFHLDGYSLICTRDLEAIKSGADEKFFQKILQAEGIVRDVGMTDEFPVSGLAGALKRLVRTQKLVSVECEVEDDEQFFAGKIIGVAGKTAQMRTFDARGRWDSKPEAIDTAAVTLVSWDTEYLRVFAKHMG